jgi:ribosome recycling factor
VIQDVLKEAEVKMRGAVKALEDELATIRTGRATPALVDKVQVEYYGTPTLLNQLASISVPEARQLLIKPFDPATLQDIEKAILTSDLGLNPGNDGKPRNAAANWSRLYRLVSKMPAFRSVMSAAMPSKTCANLKKRK